MNTHLKRRRLTATVATLATLSAGGMIAATSLANPAAAEAGGPIPTVSLALFQDDPSNDSTLDFKVSFSEPVRTGNSMAAPQNNLAVADIVVTPAPSAIALASVASGPCAAPDTSFTCASIFLIGISPGAGSSPGTVYSVSIPADVTVEDLHPSHPGNQASNVATITYDNVRPTVNLVVTTPDDPTNDDPIVFTATFSEPVTGFVSANVNVTGGTATVVPVSTTVYTINVSPAGDGPVTVKLPNNAAMDLAGNLSTNSVPRTVTSDQTPPVINNAPDVTVDATSAAGASVTFAPTATDAIDPSVPVTCVPVSGTTFPIGTTTVTCNATDDAGNTATEMFDVTVNIADTVLVANPLVVEYGKGASNRLTATLTRADNGDPIAGQPIRFTIGDGSPSLPFTTVCGSRTTNINGVARCRPDRKELKAASLNGEFTASFAGNVFLEPESDVGPVS